MTHFELEKESGYKKVAGLDEAGRGPICGPVVAGAAMIKPEIWNDNSWGDFIDDSKKMTEKSRARAYDFLMNEQEKGNILLGVAIISPEKIDQINILQASLLGMEQAAANLKSAPDFCLIDGNKMPKLNGKAIVKGDGISKSIACASIIAKETRDRIMRELAKDYPEYNWAKNKGYPTKEHLEKIRIYGVNEHYRKTYGPVAEILKKLSLFD